MYFSSHRPAGGPWSRFLGTLLVLLPAGPAIPLAAAGEVDYLPDDAMPAARIDEVRLRGDYHSVSGSAIYYFTFDLRREPFRDVRVRKALALALDPQNRLRG